MTRIGKNRITNERRIADQRRMEGERRFADDGAPERRLFSERRQQDMGPPERRVRVERRDNELGPPSGWRDRRRFAERRLLAVTEVCFDEWMRLRATLCSSASDQDASPGDHETLGKLIIRD